MPPVSNAASSKPLYNSFFKGMYLVRFYPKA